MLIKSGKFKSGKYIKTLLFKMLLSILFLVGTLMCSLGSTQTQQGNQPGNTNNAGCQSAAGILWIPGQSGQNGLPGRDGIRGDRGEPGLSIKGDKGDNGDRGQPGPEGHAGEIGSRGLQGLPGEIGPQGLPGDRTRKSAFTAIKTTSQTGVNGDVIRFDEVQTNINNHFSLETSKFTCQVSGTYVFMFTIEFRGSDPVIYLVKNGILVVGAFKSNASGWFMGGNSAIIDLVEGDMVWIQFSHFNTAQSIYSDFHKYVTFSGYLLYEI